MTSLTEKNHRLKLRCSLLIIKHWVQAEINSHAMVFCEAESLHHMRNGWVSWLLKGQNLQKFEWHTPISGRDYWFWVSWVEMLVLKMLSTHSLTKIGLQMSEARKSSNGKCKVLFHMTSIKLNYIKISFRKISLWENPHNMSASAICFISKQSKS